MPKSDAFETVRGGSSDIDERALQFAATDRLITEFEAEHGPVTDYELSRARGRLRQARKRRG